MARGLWIATESHV